MSAGHEASGIGFMEAIKTANLLVVIGIVYFAAGKGIAAGVRARAQTISDRLLKSKETLVKMKAELAAAQSELAQIDKVKAKLLADVRVEGEKLAASILNEARTTADRILSDAKAAANEEGASAVRKLKEKVVSEAIAKAAQSFQDGSLNGTHQKVHEQLVDNFSSGIRDEKSASNKGVTA